MVQELMTGKYTEKHRAVFSKKRQRPFILKKSQIHSFLQNMKAGGKAEGTLKKYSSDITRFYDFLGEEKWVYSDSLPRWKEDMINAGYAERSINASIVAVNSLYDYLGCWEWQLFDWMELKQDETQDFTRQQYHRLLHEARKKQNVQQYLLVKLFACTEVTPGELPLVTWEAIIEGVVTGKKRGGRENVLLPESLRRDLMEFAIHQGIRSGPIFLGLNGKCIDRTMVSRHIALLGEEAGLPAGAANPRNLRRMYLNTLAQFQRQAQLWVTQSYNHLLEEEEADHGWHSCDTL